MEFDRRERPINKTKKLARGRKTKKSNQRENKADE